MIINPFDKAKLEKKYPGAKYAEITADYEAGKTYFCGYWHEVFTVPMGVLQLVDFIMMHFEL